MPWLRKLSALIRRARIDEEMCAEMKTHLDLQADRHRAAGMDPDDARYAAQRDFGNVARIQQEAREGRWGMWVEQTWRDLGYAARALRRNPGFSLVAIVTLTLSIGACLVMFAVADSLLLRPLDNPDPDRLVTLRSRSPANPDLGVSPADFVDWQKGTRSFTAMAARNEGIWTLTGEGEPRRMRTMHVTPGYTEVLGLRPALGRTFLPEETGDQPARVVLVSHALWQSLFGGRSDVIGRTVRLNEEPFTIVGVLPANLERAGGVIGWNDIMLPLVFPREWMSQRGARAGNVTVQARLKPGVSVAQAQAEIDLLCAQLAQRYPDTNQGMGATVSLTGEMMTRSIRPALWSLLGAVACVLLIACANVASLLLVRATVRQREISLRTAFGATRARVLRLLLAENLMLSLAGGAGGALLAAGGIELISNLRFHNSVGLAQLALVKLDPRMLGMALVLSVGTGLLFGLAPAWMSSRSELSDALKSGSRGATESGAGGRLRSALVVFEIAAALTLFVCAGLLTRSFLKLADFDAGIDPTRVAYANVTLQGSNYRRAENPDESDRVAIAFAESALRRLQALPGVESVGVTANLPAITVGDSRTGLTFTIAGRPEVPRNERPVLQWNNASPEYFDTMGIRLVSGRRFTAHDNRQSPRVALINETLARLYFPGEDPLGQRLRVDNYRLSAWVEIVGVVSDTVFMYGQTPGPQVYEPFAQVPSYYLHFAVRTAGDPSRVVPSLKPAIHAVDPSLAVPWATTMTQTIGSLSTLARQRFIVQLLAVFSAIALVIAMVGIYGVISYSVSRRTAEIGIRMALGANVADVLRLVLGQAARLAGLGVLMGLVGSALAGQAIETMLYQTSALDPLTFVVVVGLLAGAALLACWLPARRAAKVDPMIALRAE